MSLLTSSHTMEGTRTQIDRPSKSLLPTETRGAPSSNERALSSETGEYPTVHPLDQECPRPGEVPAALSTTGHDPPSTPQDSASLQWVAGSRPLQPKLATAICVSLHKGSIAAFPEDTVWKTIPSLSEDHSTSPTNHKSSRRRSSSFGGYNFLDRPPVSSPAHAFPQHLSPQPNARDTKLDDSDPLYVQMTKRYEARLSEQDRLNAALQSRVENAMRS